MKSKISGIFKLEKLISKEMNESMFNISEFLNVKILQELLKLIPNMNKNLLICKNQYFSFEYRFLCLQIINNLCSIVNQQKEIDFLINIGIIKKFIELLNHNNDHVKYKSLIGLTNIIFYNNFITLQITEYGLIKNFINILEIKKKQILNVKLLSEKNIKIYLHNNRIIKQISWINLNISLLFLHKKDSKVNMLLLN